MPLYRIIVTEEVDYSINLEADNEEEAAKMAKEAHTEGVDSEVDSRVTGTEVTLLAKQVAASETEFDTEYCHRCEKLVTTPVYDEGDQRWLPEDQWRVWCSERCHEDDAEAAQSNG